jgi:hypothetical protein
MPHANMLPFAPLACIAYVHDPAAIRRLQCKMPLMLLNWYYQAIVTTATAAAAVAAIAVVAVIVLVVQTVVHCVLIMFSSHILGVHLYFKDLHLKYLLAGNMHELFVLITVAFI